MANALDWQVWYTNADTRQMTPFGTNFDASARLWLAPSEASGRW
jgi:hypothetical protein